MGVACSMAAQPVSAAVRARSPQRGVVPRAGGHRPAGGQCGGQARQQDVEATFEFGGAVVAGQDGGQAAEQREFADRQPVQAEPQQIIGLVGVLDEFLELVQDVAVQEPEQGPVDVQGTGSAEPGSGEQGQDVLQGAQGAGRAPISGTTCGWASASAR